MKFRIYYQGEDGHYDSFIVEGEDIQEIQINATYELSKRGIDSKDYNVWSEEI